ncbi:phage tail tape measure protein [Marisediminicola sp. LYQ134]|uniref:phage tail tape measure protein n=1 Tax=Marisediminicola sp. LYQ134 TaxID=3391061 RepID=UPI003983A6E7
MALRTAELEMLFTANIDQVEKADKYVKSTAERIEKKPIKATVAVDSKDALAGMARIEDGAKSFGQVFDRVSAAAKKPISQLARDFLESERATKQSAAEIESVLVKSYGVGQKAAAELAAASKTNFAEITAAAKKLSSTDVQVEVDVDTVDAIAGMERVEAAARKLVSENTALKLDADISRAEKNLERATQRLADLEVRALGGIDVTADVRRAEANLSRIDRTLAGLQSARTQIEVDADPTQAESRLSRFFSRFRSDATAAGDAGGRSFSEGLDSATRGAGEKVGDVVGGDIEGSLIAALTAIPIAGGIILGGVAIGKAITGAIQDGLSQEVGFDRLQGLTGISEADALRLGRAAGEAYANNFGSSIESNMDITRLALQFDIIDADSTTRDAQRVVEGLGGIADVLGEDVSRAATAVTILMRTGLARSAEEAYDILASGAREGLNRNEDLLDTLTEYPVVLERLGLSSKDTLGLLNQGLEAGARNTDVVADSLKEFQIRSTDASEASAAGYERIGLNAEEMTAKIAAGGEGAREGLQQVLDGLRNLDDPVQRNAAAVELFGTKAEDLGDALFALDLTTAAGQFNDLEGSARRMFDTLADNDATKIQGAQRNIEIAADGIKGALAAAFSEPLQEAADFVSQNRGPVLQFLLDMANGALDFGVTMVDAAADGAIALGEFIAGPGADMLQLVANLQKYVNPFADTSELDDMIAEMREFDDTTAGAAERMRDDLGSGIESARERLNEFGDGAVAVAFLNDASLRLAESLAQVGVDAEGAAISLDGVDTANLRSSESGRILEAQIRASVGALGEELNAASAAGEGQAALAERYDAGTQALVAQLVQMGLTEKQARSLIETVLDTPSDASTEFSSNAPGERGKVQALADRIVTLPDGSVYINANTADASARLAQFVRDLNNIPGRRDVIINQVVQQTGAARGAVASAYQALGGVMEFYANGGMRGLTPMAPVAQVVPASTWRVVGDRGDVPESYIPLDGSARSMAILLETMRRMGVTPMSEGGITRTDNGPRTTVSMVNNITAPPDEDLRVFARYFGREVAEQLPWR